MHEILKTQGNVAAQVERAMLSFVPCGTLLEVRLNRWKRAVGRIIPNESVIPLPLVLGGRHGY
jgi:hypothetical protein